MSTHHIYVALGLAIWLTAIATVQSEPVLTVTDAQIFLEKYGYLNPIARNSHNAHLLDSRTWNTAMKDFQSFYGLNITGELNDETRQLMSQPRCRVPDKFDFIDAQRSKRFALFHSRWHRNEFTYKIISYPNNLTKSDVDDVIARAFAVWSEHADLNFTVKETGPAIFKIQFVKGEHDGHTALDGRKSENNTLAHAAAPHFGDGKICFDIEEDWSIGSPNGTDLFEAAVHEIGHALGLKHSNFYSALMFAYSKPYNPNLRLHEDDILGIQELFGKKPKRVPSISQSNVCEDNKIDAILKSGKDKIYLFTGNLYYAINTYFPWSNTHPHNISDGWPGLPGNIDAAFTDIDGETHFFKGDQHWCYIGHNLKKGYPQNIAELIPNYVGRFDAAIVWPSSSDVLLFSRHQYFHVNQYFRIIYPPRNISSLGLPNDLNAAYVDEMGVARFFKRRLYYQIPFTNSLVDPIELHTRDWLFFNSVCKTLSRF